MADRDEDTPSVAKFADHEMITPPHKLRKAMRNSTERHQDVISRAETALRQLSAEFETWMNAECERLEGARREIKGQGFSQKTHDALYRAAHDIKGEAATFGYPAVAGIANSLCRLVEHTPEMTRIPVALVDQHVDAVRAIVREYARNDLPIMASELTRRLREVTDEFLRVENSFRPDYLERIFAAG
jgi:HPt (histidine-containing phosphotransfer) domain-containing protein